MSSIRQRQRHPQKLMTEIFKVKIRIAPELIKGVFEFTDVPYNQKNQCTCNCIITCTERCGIETCRLPLTMNTPLCFLLDCMLVRFFFSFMNIR